jgi:glycosyltransferase involved in cell wall biosynthesis
LMLASHERVDVVHFLYVDRCELAILMSLHRQSRPAAVFGTLFWPYFVHEGLEQLSWGKQLFHSVNQRALNRLLSRGIMSGLFVHSERIRTLVAERLSGPSIRDRISVVPDPAKEAPPITHEEAREALGLPATDPVLLFFGDARPDKGPDILLKVLPELAGDWVTVFAGAAGAVGEAEAEACRRALPDPCRLVTRFGYVPEAEADRYFRAADVVILPYRKAFKGTSGILRRAAASGKPVIATDVGDVGPTVREAGLGVVIPPESAVHLAAALRDFLAHRVQVTSAVEPRAIEYARSNDWRILGTLTREQYVAALESQQQSQSELRVPPT